MSKTEQSEHGGAEQGQLHAPGSGKARIQHDRARQLPLNVEAELHGVRGLQAGIEHLEHVTRRGAGFLGQLLHLLQEIGVE